MIIIDRALAERVERGNPIRVALVGAGFSGSTIAHQVLSSFPGIRLVAIANRTLDKAKAAYARAGVSDVEVVSSTSELERAIRLGRPAITEDAAVVCEAEEVEVIIEATGTIEFGAGVKLKAIQHGKHVVSGNVELDATLGPILKSYADRAGVMYSNTDGDEPGVAMNQIRFARSIGLTPLVAGNLKGMYDRYRTPETQRAFAEKAGQKPSAMTSFADGTKLSMELNVLANASGFRVAQRGMLGPSLGHISEAPAYFADKLLAEGGMVDFTVGAAPANGAFVLAHTTDPVKAAYLKYLKMGDGPLYAFYTPFHLPQLELPLTIARAVLFRDATVAPMGAPVCDSVAVAKRDLKAGETLDGIGGFTCYTLLENYDVSLRERALPMGLSEGCILVRDVKKDSLVTYDDVRLPASRLADRLRDEQNAMFARNSGSMAGREELALRGG